MQCHIRQQRKPYRHRAAVTGWMAPLEQFGPNDDSVAARSAGKCTFPVEFSILSEHKHRSVCIEFGAVSIQHPLFECFN